LGYVDAVMLITISDCWANERLRFQHFHTLLLNLAPGRYSWPANQPITQF
jgi:hypothetical protein